MVCYFTLIKFGCLDHAQSWDSSNIVAGMLGHSLAILMTTYARLARFARSPHYVCVILVTQAKLLGFAVTCHAIWRSLASAAQGMDDILTPIPSDLRVIKREKSYTAANLFYIFRITQGTDCLFDFH